MGKLLRCAIYTRVSTEHGLDQEFNSLDNQREAAEAYVKSQAHEGWRLLRDRFDDGGFSGGAMERPALLQLLEQVRLRRVDVIVVYKVDRLTRSLADFAKLVELFDAHGVSFVSVTQAFNTTTSMGRLTLNVLLSFAQFEREVTGERIRDKIAASKQKGIWMGGVVPLGYRIENRALHIVDEHAAVIRDVYARYLRIGSIGLLTVELDRCDVRVPRRMDGAGRVVGGVPFSLGYLDHLLKSPLYIGRLPHKGQVHDGQHDGIIDEVTWHAVRERLAENKRGHRHKLAESSHLLVGRIRDSDGIALTPSHAQKGPRRYRYYVSQAVLQRQECRSGIRRLAAPEVEAAVLSALRSTIPAPEQPEDGAVLIRSRLRNVIVHSDRLELRLTGEEGRVVLHPWSATPARRGRELVLPPDTTQTRVMKAEDRARILRAIARGRAWMNELITSKIASPAAIAAREILSERSVRMTLSLAHLAPAIVKAIIDGRLPRGIGIRDLAELPASWREQQCALGI